MTTDPENYGYEDMLNMDLDEEEASAIALSLETKDAILILYDLKARKVSDWPNARYAGTLGLVLKVKQVGIIKSLKPVLDKT